MNVLIIGAGPTGLTLAVELARQGIKPQIVERRTEPSTLSRAVGIMPGSIDKLRMSGAAEPIEKEAMGILKVSINHDGNELLGIDFTKLPNQPVRHMLGLPQNRTETLIADVLADKYGVEVEYGCEVTAVSTIDDTATVEFKNKESETYDWVIGADGVGSIVRESLGINYPGIDLEGEWSIADVDIAEGSYDPSMVSIWIQEEANDHGSFSMILPIEENRVRVVSATPDALAALPTPLDVKNIRRTGTFTISVRQADTYLKGRVMLAGDAAHCHSPVGGRGMNLGIDDAVAAAKAIVEGTTDEYSEERHIQGKKVLDASEQARKIIMSTSLLTQLSTKAMMSLISHSKTLQQLLLKQLTTL